MSYATIDDLSARMGEDELLQVADRDISGAADGEVVAAALNQADDRINAALGVRFRLPLSSTPAVVKAWAVSIARYTLHRDGAPDHVVRDYKEAIADLDRAARGTLAVPGAEGVEPVTAGADTVSHTASEPSFTRDKLEGWL